jgi:hypothetical protein
MQERANKIKFLIFDETNCLFSVIKDKRDRSIFLDRLCSQSQSFGNQFTAKTDLDFKQFRIMIHRLKGSRSELYSVRADKARTI